jgi:hypothetical protein
VRINYFFYALGWKYVPAAWDLLGETDLQYSKKLILAENGKEL